MKANEFVKRAAADGWYLVKHGAKHDIYVHPSKIGRLYIPRHQSKELAPGTLQSLMAIAKLGQ